MKPLRFSFMATQNFLLKAHFELTVTAHRLLTILYFMEATFCKVLKGGAKSHASFCDLEGWVH